jgi:hypothetical protein
MVYTIPASIHAALGSLQPDRLCRWTYILHVITHLTPQILDVIDCTGSGDIDTSKVVKADEQGVIPGASGRPLRVNPDWTNPSGEWRVGCRPLLQLLPRPLQVGGVTQPGCLRCYVGSAGLGAAEHCAYERLVDVGMTRRAQACAAARTTSSLTLRQVDMRIAGMLRCVARSVGVYHMCSLPGCGHKQWPGAGAALIAAVAEHECSATATINAAPAHCHHCAAASSSSCHDWMSLLQQAGAAWMVGVVC